MMQKVPCCNTKHLPANQSLVVHLSIRNYSIASIHIPPQHPLEIFRVFSMVLFESRAFNTTSSAVDEFDLWPPSFIQQLGYAGLCWAMLGYAGLCWAHGSS